MKSWKISGLSLVLLVAVSFYFWKSNSNHQQGTWEKSAQHSSKHVSPITERNMASSVGSIQEINDRIIAIKTKQEIIPLITFLNTVADKPENKDNHTLQLYRAVLTPLKHLQGVVWRMRGVVEQSGSLHMQALNVIRKIYYNDYLYGPHIMAVVDYLVEPNINEKKFMNMGHAQDFLENTIKAELKTSLAKVEMILASTDDDYSFVWDAFLVTGHDPANNKVFLSQNKRFKRSINKAYINFVAGNIHRLIGGIDYLVNYNLNQFPQVVNAIVKKTAINNFIKQKFHLQSLPQPTTPLELMAIINATSSKRVGHHKNTRTIRYKAFANFLTLRKEEAVAKENLTRAMKHFYNARKYELTGFTNSIDTTDHDRGDRYILNPNALKLNRESTERRLKDIIALYEKGLKNQSKVVISNVTGRSTEVNIAALFTPHQDLKEFLPTPEEGFNNKISRGGIMRDENGKKIRHAKTQGTIFAWNYKYGLPLAWPSPTFGGFLPNASSDKMYEIARSLELTDSLSVFKSFLPIP